MCRPTWSLLTAVMVIFFTAGAVPMAGAGEQGGETKRKQTRSVYTMSPTVPDNVPSESDTGQRTKGNGATGAGDGDKASGPATSGPTTGSVTRSFKARNQ